MYNNALPQKYKINVSISFKNLIFFSLINYNFDKTSSSIKYGLVSIGQAY